MTNVDSAFSREINIMIQSAWYTLYYQRRIF